MNKWLYRSVGAVGLASGICLVAGGAAHANEALPPDGTDAGSPAANPLGAPGGLVPGLSDLLFNPHSVSRPAGDAVLTGDLAPFKTLPATAPTGTAKTESDIDAPRNINVGRIDVPRGPTDLRLRQEPDNSSGISQNGVGVLLAAGAGLNDSDDDRELLASAPATPTATVERDALGVTALPTRSGHRAEDLPMLPSAARVLDQVSLNGAPLSSKEFPGSLGLRPTADQGAWTPAAEPAAMTRTGRPSPRPRAGERPVAGIDSEYANR